MPASPIAAHHVERGDRAAAVRARAGSGLEFRSAGQQFVEQFARRLEPREPRGP